MGNLAGYLPKETETVKRIYNFHERIATGRAGPHRGRLGASIIGQPCERRLWYTFRQLEDRKFTGRILRLFETGHMEEPRFIHELRGIGCTVYDQDDETGEQFEFLAFGGHFVCHPDAIILGVPEAPKTWHIGEFKTMGGTETEKSKDFEKVSKEGVKRAKPEHYSQMQCGMGLAGLTRALYLSKKKATDELYSERVKYSAADFKNLMDRAERIIRAENPPERCTKRADDFRCRFCGIKELCWGTANVAVPIPKITCRSCCHATPEIDDGETWARWSCKRHKCDLSMMEQSVACDHHLLLPGLVSFADPADAGADWIEFQNHSDGAHWRHGAGEGTWTTEELAETPGPLVGEKHVEAVKTTLNGTVEGFDVPELNLIEKYDPSDNRLLWEGMPDQNDTIEDVLGKLLMVPGGEALPEPSDRFEDEAHDAYEFDKRFLLVIYKDHDYAAIWEGME